MPECDNSPPDPFSKSQKKRDMHALQDLGVQLLKLSKSELAMVPLPDELLEAIQFAKTLKMDSSYKRQLQYIGKLMRQIDPLPIQTALKNIKMR